MFTSEIEMQHVKKVLQSTLYFESLIKPLRSLNTLKLASFI